MTLTLKNEAGILVPQSVQRRAGIKAGDQVEFRVSGGMIHIIPKVPSTDEYTPEQQKVIDRRSGGRPGRRSASFQQAA